MSKHVVLGAGAVGRHTAELLGQDGHDVVVASRSANGPDLGPARRVAADAADPEVLSGLTEGATAIYNCLNPPRYGRWEQTWPDLSRSLLTAARRTGATLVTTSNLYPYGPVNVPMTASLPDVAQQKNGVIRAQMWREAKAAHDAGDITAVEVRASDFIGSGLGAQSHLVRNVAGAIRGKRAWVVGNPDLRHSWTDVHDVARTLVTVAQQPDSWGRVWLAPTNPPRSQREALRDVLAAGGYPMVPMTGMPRAMLRGLGLFSPDLRALSEMDYIFSRPYVVDSSETERGLGLTPTPWNEVCARTIGSVIARTDA